MCHVIDLCIRVHGMHVSAYVYFVNVMHVSAVAGEEDPWEPVDEGRKFGDAASVEEFISFPGLQCCLPCLTRRALAARFGSFAVHNLH